MPRPLTVAGFPPEHLGPVFLLPSFSYPCSHSSVRQPFLSRALSGLCLPDIQIFGFKEGRCLSPCSHPGFWRGRGWMEVHRISGGSGGPLPDFRIASDPTPSPFFLSQIPAFPAAGVVRAGGGALAGVPFSPAPNPNPDPHPPRS